MFLPLMLRYNERHFRDRVGALTNMGAGLEKSFLSPCGSVNTGHWLSLIALYLVFLGHVTRNPVISHSCETMIGNRKQGNPYLETEKAKVCPKRENSFSIHHPPLLMLPPPLPLMQMGPTFIVWHKSMPGSIYGRLRKVFSW